MKKIFTYALVALATVAMLACSKPAANEKEEENKEPEKKEFNIADYEVNAALAGAETWGLIGPAQAGGWDADTDLTKVSEDPEMWKAEIELGAAEFKFRGNDEWKDYDLGGGTVVLGEPILLSKGGGNMTLAEAGTYEVILYPQHMVLILNKK